MHNLDSNSKTISGIFSAPLWKSAFRPFYLFGVVYGLGVMSLWMMMFMDVIDIVPDSYSLSIWHGHEMVFGFSGAIVVGFVLTALPGWAGTEEIDRGPLAFLVLLWGLGRIAFHSVSLLPAPLVLGLDSSLYLVTMLMVMPGLFRAENKFYLALLPILFLMFLGNVLFHLAVMEGDMERASWAIRIGVLAIVGKFILAGGFLTTVFTGNALRQKGIGDLKVNVPLEYVSALSLLLFIYAALRDIPSAEAAGYAFFAALVQAIRLLRWRTLRVLDEPLVVVMHFAYGWFVAALVLFGLEKSLPGFPPNMWLHAFTVGALGMMMLSLITRVALRHTGRALKPAKAMILAYYIMFICAAVRVAVTAEILALDWLSVSALIWILSFMIYILLHGFFMVKASLPRS